jgi:5'-deoxynucleotidase YfbR-like HD superfamily hydrolase
VAVVKDKPYLVVHGGHKVYFLEPKPSDYDPLRVAKALANENRFAGSYGPYSVTQHQVLVSLAVEALGGTPRQQLAGLVHDAAEMVTGDIPSPLKKYFMGYNYIEALQNTAIEARYKVYLDDPIVRDADKLLFAAEVRMLVPKAQQSAFDIDPKYRLEVQPGWANVMPWDYHESVSGWMDRFDALTESIVPSDPDERS